MNLGDLKNLKDERAALEALLTHAVQERRALPGFFQDEVERLAQERGARRPDINAVPTLQADIQDLRYQVGIAKEYRSDLPAPWDAALSDFETRYGPIADALVGAD